MADRVSFSGQQQSPREVATFRANAVAALRGHYDPDSPGAVDRWATYDPDEVRGELSACLLELDRQSTMALLAAVEATLRVDYLVRCHQRKRDRLSRAFRAIYRAKQQRAELDEDILTTWQVHDPSKRHALGDLKGAFGYRNWLAHGRYWTPKLGRRYDFETVYELSEAVLTELPLLTSDDQPPLAPKRR